MLPDLVQAAELVARHSGITSFKSAVILGSGLGDVVDRFSPVGSLDYTDIPGFPSGLIPGHAGKLFWAGQREDRLLFFQGRFHLYQDLSVYDVVAPVVLAHALGCKSLIITNASGAINGNFEPGDPVYVTDHINLSGETPLRGINPPPFLDVCGLYQPDQFKTLKSVLQPEGITLHQGVLAYMPGPSYETPAEVEMLKRLGADLVSMSTVHEALAAHYFGLKVFALSIISNAAAGLSGDSLEHKDVLAVGKRSAEILSKCVRPLLAFS